MLHLYEEIRRVTIMVEVTEFSISILKSNEYNPISDFVTPPYWSERFLEHDVSSVWL